jgi:hypothetical protein
VWSRGGGRIHGAGCAGDGRGRAGGEGGVRVGGLS